MRKLIVVLTFLATVLSGYAQKVAIHDPSIVIVYKDASGNSFPENDAGNTRTKYYYIFGTHLGGAYSRDLINWTPFTPSILLNGNVSTQYYQIFKEEADYAMHYTNGDVRGNLWAPDVIFNKDMNKWCLYFSLSGNEFKSSIILLTADRIEGPYQKVGGVVYSGFRNNEGSIARDDYAQVTGNYTVDGRYLRNGAWFNDYGVSCIDPAVLYDENGQLWMNYGSWSGGIFLLKLNNQTGMRDNSQSYGNNAVWDGSRLRADPYLGYHIAGGYYVSGEGPYIEYIEDQDGQGYYYMFVTMGFFDPNTGYTMRVYRSSTIDGVYRDITGTDAVFANWVFNYGSNMTYGFPIMQNYRWNWWSIGQTAQGHNSLLQDEDGTDLLVYHTKYDNQTYHHNVEVHQLFHPENGWIVASPFEYRKGFGVQDYKEYTAEDIAGVYGVILHDPVDYENYETNREELTYLNADGTITGAFTGNWIYNYASGKQYVTLNTNRGNFQAVFCEELMDGLSTHTLAFSGVNNSNERAIWGYRYTKTATTTTTNYGSQALTVGMPDFSLVWNAYDQFHQVDVSGEFEVEFVFDNFTEAVENWHNWALFMTDGNSNWYLRADAWSNETFAGATVNYQYDWNWDTEFKQVFANKEVRLVISRIGTTINVIAFVEGEQVYAASSKNSTEGDLTIYLGGEAVYQDIKKSSVSLLNDRQVVGVTTDNGTYTSGFNSVASPGTTVSGDFELKYSFYNHRQAFNADNWDNYIVRAVSGGQTMLLRADAYALDPMGSVSHSADWPWENFADIMMGALVEMTISRTGSTVVYDATITATDGQVYHYVTTNTGAPTADMTFSLTMEQSMVDLIETEVITYETCSNETADADNDGTPDCQDFCPNDPAKTAPGTCGCGVADTDSDGDGIADCDDEFPNDFDNDGITTNDDCDDTNVQIGEGTLWYADIDNDGLGDAASTMTACDQPQGYVANAGDECPSDGNKTTPGTCGCGVADTDSDADGIADCNDTYPNDFDNDGVTINDDCDDNNPDLGLPSTWYVDADNDGVGSASSTMVNCTQPQGYVATAGDECPNDGNKTTPGDCGCGATEQSCLDCAGIPNGNAVYDDCGVCGGSNACLDCNGEPNGGAYYDNCNICVGGSTDLAPCEQDCSGEWGGSASFDACNECTGGNTGFDPITDPQLCIATSLETFDRSENLVYPNPTSGMVYLNEATNWVLYDMTGMEIKRGNATQFSLSNYAPGIYFLHIDQMVIKVVKE